MRDRCTMLWKKIQYRVPYDMSDRRWLIAMYTMSFSILAFFVFLFIGQKQQVEVLFLIMEKH